PEHLTDAVVEERVNAAVVEVAAHLRRDDDFRALAGEGRAEDFFAMPVTVHVGGVEEGASQIERSSDRPLRLRVIGGAVGIAVRVAADGPGSESDLRNGEPGAAQDALVHATSSARAALVATGREQVVPTQTVACGRSPERLITTRRGRQVCNAARCIAHASPGPRGPATSMRVTG